MKTGSKETGREKRKGRREKGRDRQMDRRGKGGERKEEWMARLKQKEMKYLYLTSLFFDDPKAHTGNLLELINQFGEALGCKKKNNIQRSIAFYIVAIKTSKLKLRKQFHLK